MTKIEVNIRDRYANEIIAELAQYKDTESKVLATICKWKLEKNDKRISSLRKRVTSRLAYSHHKSVLDCDYNDIFIAKRRKK